MIQVNLIHIQACLDHFKTNNWILKKLLTGEVFFKREKHGQKFTIYNDGEREWMHNDPVIEKERSVNCFD